MTTPNDLYGTSPIALADRRTARFIAQRLSGASGGITGKEIADLFDGTKGADLASGTTVDLGAATGMFVHITGSAPITGFGTADAGILRLVTFDASPPLTYNATSLILPTGASITPAAGDSALFVSEGSGNWRCLAYLRSNGAAVAANTDPVNALATSGTIAIDCALGNYFTLAASGNMTSFTFSNLPAAGRAQTIMIRITQDATGSRIATWPASFKWAGGTTGALSTPANAIDVLAITTFDQGTTWIATLSKAFA